MSEMMSIWLFRRGWEEVEKRLKIWDITATYCNSFSKTLIGPLIAVHCPRFGRLVVQGKLRDPQPRWCPMAMRRIRMCLDQNPKGIRWGSFPKVCWGRTWGRTVELCRNHPTKNITKRFVHVIHVFNSRAKKKFILSWGRDYQQLNHGYEHMFVWI